MVRKVGDIIKLVPVDETKHMRWDLILDGLNYTEDSEFKIIEVDESEPLDGQRYLVNGTNGENEERNQSLELLGFWVAEMHIVD